jgi:5'-3' exonuclease
MTEALVDSDLVAYRCAASCNGESTPDLAIQRAHELTERILTNVNADSFTLYLSGSNNFRKKINPQYKANRTQEKPIWLEHCREFLITEWKAKVTDGYEADDALGMAQTETSIICSLDKDLLMVPGQHYQWDISGKTVKGEVWEKPETYYTITKEEGLLRFWTQMIVGDKTDNIFGVEGLGPVKAGKALNHIQGETLEELGLQYFDTVRKLYNDDNRLYSNASCLWIMQHETDIWVSPLLDVDRSSRESIVASLKQILQQP